MLKPLEQFICDKCSNIIEKPEDGWIEWLSKFKENSIKLEQWGFKIVHHYTESPLIGKTKNGCYFYQENAYKRDDHLHHLLNHQTIPYLLSFLDLGPYHDFDFSGPSIVDMREYVEFARRLTIPYYEEARIYWNIALEDGYFDGFNELYIYNPNTLKNLIDKYGK